MGAREGSDAEVTCGMMACLDEAFKPTQSRRSGSRRRASSIALSGHSTAVPRRAWHLTSTSSARVVSPKIAILTYLLGISSFTVT